MILFLSTTVVSPCCRKPWYEQGRSSSLVCLSEPQCSHVAQKLAVDVSIFSCLPPSICPLSAAIHMSGIPRIEEYPVDEDIDSHRPRQVCPILVYSVWL